MKKIILVFLFLMICAVSLIQADVIEDLTKLGEENAKMYIKPFVNAFGSDLNSGWFSTAKTAPLSFGLTFNAMLAVVPDKEKTFLAHNPNTELYNGDYEVSATVWGKDGAVFTTKDPQVTPDLFLPPGVNFGMIPLVVPQAHLGLPAGFEVELRYIPPYEIKDLGKLTFIGGGVKYQVSKLIPMLSALIPISIQGTYQQLKVGDEVTVNSSFVNLHASRGLVVLPVTIYGGIGYEMTKLKAKYTYKEPWTGTDVPIDFDIDGDNGFRLTAGARLKILLIDVMLDYSVAKYQTVRLGVGFSI
ncbi:MAG: hypothetical protein JW794_05685 [Candidatus Cloacimonetes bacterium]|nr:hypothetical protein [Candidatus Cloacimonadota bacterium]